MNSMITSIFSFFGKILNIPTYKSQKIFDLHLTLIPEFQTILKECWDTLAAYNFNNKNHEDRTKFFESTKNLKLFINKNSSFFPSGVAIEMKRIPRLFDSAFADDYLNAISSRKEIKEIEKSLEEKFRESLKPFPTS